MRTPRPDFTIAITPLVIALERGERFAREELDDLRYAIARAGFGFARIAITHDGRLTDEFYAWLKQREAA